MQTLEKSIKITKIVRNKFSDEKEKNKFMTLLILLYHILLVIVINTNLFFPVSVL